MTRLEIGIVGLPNVGKSTLFKVLTKQDVVIANYPFATIDPNVGIVPVPDERLEKLTALSKSKKTIPAVVEFYDIAGLVKGANKGEGLGNQFLANIKETQAIVIVLRVFQNPDIIHVENSVDALRDLEIINTELILKDLEAVEKQLAKFEAEARAGKKEAIQNREDLGKIKKILEDGTLPVSSPEMLGLIRANKTIWELNLLTAKKQLYLLNGSPSDVPEALTAKIKELGADSLVLDLVTTTSVGDLIRKAYDILNLISYFTTGEDETRASNHRAGNEGTAGLRRDSYRLRGKVHPARSDRLRQIARSRRLDCGETKGLVAARRKRIRSERRRCRRRPTRIVLSRFLPKSHLDKNSIADVGSFARMSRCRSVVLFGRIRPGSSRRYFIVPY